MADQARRFTDNQWHLDKRVPVALIVTLLAQGCIAIWWAAGQDAAVANLNGRVAALENRNDKIADQMRAIENRLARVEANGDAQLQALERIHDALMNTTR